MTTVTVTTEVPPRGKTEDDSLLYGSTPAHIIEETEYVRKIRTTLEKIRNHMFKDEEGHSNASHKLDTERTGKIQNGSDSTPDPTCLDLLMENMRRKDQQLLEMNKENEVLQIKLEASREAGAAALRNVAQRLFDNYQTQSEDMKRKHEDSKHLLQANNHEKGQTLKQHDKNLSELSEKLEEKHVQIIGLENRVQRMENEKKILLERKLCLESKLLQLKSSAAHSKRCWRYLYPLCFILIAVSEWVSSTVYITLACHPGEAVIAWHSSDSTESERSSMEATFICWAGWLVHNFQLDLSQP